jgi:hypothetical protein
LAGNRCNEGLPCFLGLECSELAFQLLHGDGCRGGLRLGCCRADALKQASNQAGAGPG